MIVWKIKTLYGYEVGGLPCTSGYRGITVYCYLKNFDLPHLSAKCP